MKTTKSILLVEDDEDDLGFFLEAIIDIPNTTLFGVARNGQEALDQLTKATALPDIIFMDINMPCMDGVECLLEIIKKPLLKHIPVVILSTSTAQKALVCLLGAKAFIRKGCDVREFNQQIEQMINFSFITELKFAN